MQFFAIALSAFAAGAAAADVVFKATDFSAGCIPHSSQCSYSFAVIQPGTMETTPVQCKAMVAGSGGQTLPGVIDGTCEESSRTFSIVVDKNNGLYLTVSQPVTPSSNQTGSHYIAPDEITTSGEGTGVVASYSGPTSFDLTSQ